MLTPQNFREKTFERAVFGGYDMGAVDNFLDEAANDYAAIAKENMTLKQKMKVLVEKIEEYRETEGTMRQTLLSAQKLSNQIEQDAKDKAEKLLADAKINAERIVRDAYTQRTEEEERLLDAKRSSTQYIENMRMVTQKQLEFFDSLESMKLEDIGAQQSDDEAVEEAVQSIENSVEKKSDEAVTANPAIGKVVSENTDESAASEAQPTRMYKHSEPASGVNVDNLSFGR